MWWWYLGLLLTACDRPEPLIYEPVPFDDDAICASRDCGASCGGGRVCDLGGDCTGGDVDCTEPAIEDTDGWDDPPGTGRMFVISAFAIADRDRGFDVDGKCSGPGACIDNSLYRLGQLGNDQIRQGLLGGDSLILLEIAGLDAPHEGSDRSVTVKVYGGRDADDPPFPANNFSIPTGETRCCEYLIDGRSLEGGQARARIPARIVRGLLRSTSRTVGGPLQLPVPTSTPSQGLTEARVERIQLSARLPANLSEMNEGLIGGVVSMSTLAQTPNPFCKTLNNLCQRQIPALSALDLALSILQADIDLDGDGLERIEVGQDGRNDRCYDGCGTTACRVLAVDPARPESCVLDPRIVDGYSVGIAVSGVSAIVVGVGGGAP